MVTTLTLNPCIDKTIDINNFTYGGTNKVLSIRTDVSGKGVNVSIVLHQLGEDTICVGFNYSDGGVTVEKSLDAQGVPYDFVTVEGELRTNIKAFDQASRIMTEFNEGGRFVDKESITRLYEKIEEHLDHTSILVLNGSVPAGVPSDTYKAIIEIANKKGIKTVLDAADKLLVEGIKAKPYIIKPNKDEFESAFGKKIETKEDVINISREIIGQGVAYVCVSMGSDGAMLIDKDSAYLAHPLKLDVRGVQGAGDSLVAGICMAIDKDLGPEEMLRYGVTAASGSLIHEGTRLCKKEDFNELYNKVIIERI